MIIVIVHFVIDTFSAVKYDTSLGCVCYQGESSYYAVFDGHGGVEAAKYASIQLHSLLGRRLQSQPSREALHDAFLDTDHMFVDRAKREVVATLL